MYDAHISYLFRNALKMQLINILKCKSYYIFIFSNVLTFILGVENITFYFTESFN